MGRKTLGDKPMTAAERQARRRASPKRIVVHMGGAWRLSATRYGKLMAAIRENYPFDLDGLGTILGHVADPFGNAPHGNKEKGMANIMRGDNAETGATPVPTTGTCQVRASIAVMARFCIDKGYDTFKWTLQGGPHDPDGGVSDWEVTIRPAGASPMIGSRTATASNDLIKPDHMNDRIGSMTRVIERSTLTSYCLQRHHPSRRGWFRKGFHPVPRRLRAKGRPS